MLYPDYLRTDQYEQARSLLDIVKHFAQQNSGSSSPRVKSLVEVTKRLRVFGCQQLNFFSSPSLQIHPQFPREYIFALIHDQVARDFSILREAVCQYRNSDLRTRITLNVANHLGEAILEPILKLSQIKYVQSWTFPDYRSGPSDEKEPPSPTPILPELVETKDVVPIFPANTVVITYFRKFPGIRLLPYAPVALVGIPYTSISRPQDMLATPHEIGHQLFWRWRELRYQIEKLNPNRHQPAADALLDFGYKWAEEIFADTFGVHAVGAAAALFAQELEAGFDFQHFGLNDGAHPVSSIRPFVHAKALNDPSAPVVQELAKDLWDQYRSERTQNTTYATHFYDACGHATPISEAIYNDPVLGYPGLAPNTSSQPVDRLVRLSLDALAAVPAARVSHGTADDLYPEFLRFLANLPLSQPVRELHRDRAIDAQFRHACSGTKFDDQTWFDVVGNFLSEDPRDLVNRVNGNAIVPARDWLPLMDMDAWADKGPTSNPRGG